MCICVANMVFLVVLHIQILIKTWWSLKDVFYTHTIHVWYIYLHVVDFDGKCREILYHTWILWDKFTIPASSNFLWTTSWHDFLVKGGSFDSYSRWTHWQRSYMKLKGVTIDHVCHDSSTHLCHNIYNYTIDELEKFQVLETVDLGLSCLLSFPSLLDISCCWNNNATCGGCEDVDVACRKPIREYEVPEVTRKSQSELIPKVSLNKTFSG